MNGHLIVLILMLVYFLSPLHQKVMSHFGLTRRDMNLMWMGFMFPGIFSCLAALLSGVLSIEIFIMLAIYCAFVWWNYRSL
jgi:hypothetical protein